MPTPPTSPNVPRRCTLHPADARPANGAFSAAAELERAVSLEDIAQDLAEIADAIAEQPPYGEEVDPNIREAERQVRRSRLVRHFYTYMRNAYISERLLLRFL